MNKFLLGVQGYTSCFGWMFKALWEWILETCPDLKLWDTPKHPGDFSWYAERVNGRLAMLAIIIVLYLDFKTNSSIWHLIHVL